MARESNSEMTVPPALAHEFPIWLRYLTVLWLVIWFPAYWRVWGPANFLHLCDIAVFLICAGLLTNSPLLLSSQAVGSLIIDIAWMVDAGWKLVTGRGLLGSADYLFDSKYPLWVRLLTLFHVAIPVVLIWSLARLGYDRRGFALQCAITLAALLASRFTAPAENINFVFQEPLFHRTWGPAPVHVLVVWVFMIVVVYLPTHLVLRAFFHSPVARMP